MILRVLPLLLLSALCLVAAPIKDHAERIASLIDPAKLATLKTRGAIPRVQKYVHELEIARLDGAGARIRPTVIFTAPAA
ncbi:MAG: hypothetical protein EXS31_09630 [Pedosphaera sp.]|nr:hypothetical protein [Pedosphaera sp.]